MDPGCRWRYGQQPTASFPQTRAPGALNASNMTPTVINRRVPRIRNSRAGMSVAAGQVSGRCLPRWVTEAAEPSAGGCPQMPGRRRRSCPAGRRRPVELRSRLQARQDRQQVSVHISVTSARRSPAPSCRNFLAACGSGSRSARAGEQGDGRVQDADLGRSPTIDTRRRPQAPRPLYCRRPEASPKVLETNRGGERLSCAAARKTAQGGLASAAAANTGAGRLRRVRSTHGGGRSLQSRGRACLSASLPPLWPDWPRQ